MTEPTLQRLQQRPEITQFTDSDYLPIVSGSSPLWRVSVAALAARIMGLIGSISAAVTSVNGHAGDVTITTSSLGAVPESDVGQPNGLATLDGTGKLAAAQIPAGASTPLQAIGSDEMVDVGVNTSGAAPSAARADHSHGHGHQLADDNFHTAATTTTAGFMSAADKTKLNGISVGANVYTDEQVRDVMGVALVAGSGITITPNDGADTITIAAASSGATNLGNTPAAGNVALTSSTGSGTTIPAATTSLAGVLSAADKSKLDGIAAGATFYSDAMALTAIPAATTSVRGTMSAADKAKLDGVAAGATAYSDSLARAAVSASPIALPSVKEKATVAATALTGSTQVDWITNAVKYYTSNASANFSFNIRGDSTNSLDSQMAIGESVTLSIVVPQGATAFYCTAITVDGSAPALIKWFGGAPAAGNASGLDVYSVTVIKTAAATFHVIASLSQAK